MKLKRYIRTTENYIIDVSMGCQYANGHIGKYVLKDNFIFSQYDEKSSLRIAYKIVATADTILELAQYGDMVEEKGKQYLVLQYTYHLEVFKTQWKDDVVALWVRRDQDTFKRYAIKD